MKIEVIAIGNEILSGKTLDTNFPFIAEKFLEKGFEISFHSTIPDRIEVMEKTFHTAMARSDVVITTGGLGPTVDDLTKFVCSRVFETAIVDSQQVYENLIKRYPNSKELVKEQSRVPEKAVILENSVGVAPAFYFHENGSHIFILPGVPWEMQEMLMTKVLPKVEDLGKTEKKIFHKKIFLCHLSESFVDPCMRELDLVYPEVQKGIYPGYGQLSVEFKHSTKNPREALEILDQCISKIEEDFYTYVYSNHTKGIEKALQNYFIKNNLTLALAESLTGGHIASKITDHPGSSKYFLGSVVSYSNQLKKSALRVSEKALEKVGAVSKEVTEQMAQGALALTGAEYAIAVTGVAGPDGGTEDKPVGTVWCAISQKNSHTISWKIQSKGSGKRSTVIEYTANYILGALWRLVVYGESPL